MSNATKFVKLFDLNEQMLKKLNGILKIIKKN